MKKITTKYSITKNIGLLMLIAISTAILSSCGTLAPLQDKELAEKTITKAESIEAETYAPELIGNAKEKYQAGEALIVTNGKSAENEKAKIEYVESAKIALEAYNKAISPYTQKYIDETDIQLEEAKDEKVDIVFPDMYQKSKDFNLTARTELGESKFLQALSNTYKSRTSLVVVLSNTRYLKSVVDENEQSINELITIAENKKAPIAIPDEYEAVSSDYENMLTQNEEGGYKKSIAEYPELKSKVENLIEEVEAKRLLAIKELEEASQIIDDIKNTSAQVEKEVSELNKLDQDSAEEMEAMEMESTEMMNDEESKGY